MSYGMVGCCEGGVGELHGGGGMAMGCMEAMREVWVAWLGM